MKKSILITLISALTLLGSLSVYANGGNNPPPPQPTGMDTASIELTCGSTSNDVPMIAWSGNYSVASQGQITVNKTLTQILSENPTWLASISTKAYNASKKVSYYNIPCTAAVAELQRYVYTLAALDITLLARTQLKDAIPSINFAPTLTAKENGTVTYHWSVFTPTFN